MAEVLSVPMWSAQEYRSLQRIVDDAAKKSSDTIQDGLQGHMRKQR